MRFLNSNSKIETKSYVGNGFVLYNCNGKTFLFDNGNSSKKLLNLYTQIAPLNTAIKKIATLSGKIKPYLKKGEEFSQQNEFIKLLLNPYFNYDWVKFVKEFLVHRIITDNYYLLIESTGEKSKPLGIKTIRPDKVSITSYSSLDDLPYIFQINNKTKTENYIRMGIDKPRYFNKTKTNELIFMNGINTLNDEYYGVDGINSIYLQCLKYYETIRHNLSVLKNGARPTGALVLKAKDGCHANLSDEQFNKLKKQLDEEYSGTLNTGKPILLEGGLEFQPMNLTNKDMDFLDGIKFDAKSIFINLGIPLALVGEGSTTYNAYPESRLSLYQDYILPKMEQFFDFLYFKIGVPRYNLKTEELVYKESEIPSLKNDTITRGITIIEKAKEFLTQDEIRALIGFDKAIKNTKKEKEEFVKLMKKGGYSPLEVKEALEFYDTN